MNNPSSEIWENAELRINSTYNILQELPSSPLSRIVVASRYGRRMLLKCLPADCTDDMRHREALVKEFEILSSLSHDNIVKAVAMDDVPSLGLCIVMEYIEGMPLNEFIDDSTPRKVKLQLLQGILSALSYVHGKQIVHRDLKPSNIMVTDGDHVKIIDFGLSDSNSYEILKQPAGTIGYVSPEQQAGLPADPRNDIYSIGVIMREMQLGWMYAPIVKRCTGEIKNRPTAEVLQKMLRRHRSLRYSPLAAAFVGVAMLSVIPFLCNTRQQPTPEPETTMPTDTLHKKATIKDTIKTVPQSKTYSRAEIIAEAKRMIDSDVVEEQQYYDTLSSYYNYDTSRDFTPREIKKLSDYSRDKCRGYDFTTSMEIAEEINTYFSTYYFQKWMAKVQKLAEEKEKNR